MSLMRLGLKIGAFTLTLALMLGCSKPSYQVQIQEVLIPVACNLKLPKKPLEDGSFASHRALGIYYKQIEEVAKACTKEGD